MEENDLPFLRISGLAMRDGQSLSIRGSKENACSGHSCGVCKYTAKTMHHVLAATGNSRGLVAQVRTTGHAMDSKELT